MLDKEEAIVETPSERAEVPVPTPGIGREPAPTDADAGFAIWMDVRAGIVGAATEQFAIPGLADNPPWPNAAID